jgi:hypothetical protein
MDLAVPARRVLHVRLLAVLGDRVDHLVGLAVDDVDAHVDGLGVGEQVVHLRLLLSVVEGGAGLRRELLQLEGPRVRDGARRDDLDRGGGGRLVVERVRDLRLPARGAGRDVGRDAVAPDRRGLDLQLASVLRLEEHPVHDAEVLAGELDLGIRGGLVHAAAGLDADGVAECRWLAGADAAAVGRCEAGAGGEAREDDRGTDSDRCSRSSPSRRARTGPQISLLVGPTGLADGLAPKSGATNACVRFAPGTVFDTAPPVPPLRCGLAAPDSAGHLGGRSIASATVAEVGWVLAPSAPTIILRAAPVRPGAAFHGRCRRPPFR